MRRSAPSPATDDNDHGAALKRSAELQPRIVALLKAGGPLKLRKLIRELGGEASTSITTHAIGVLINNREIVRDEIAGGVRYRIPTPGESTARPGPPVRSVPVPDGPSQDALSQKIDSILASGVSYDEAEILLTVRAKWPTATADEVATDLAAKVLAGRVECVNLGSRRRYRQRSKPG